MWAPRLASNLLSRQIGPPQGRPLPLIKMLKIGMVTSCYHPVINGVVRMVEHYTKQLRQLGHEVTIFTFGPPAESDDGSIIRMAGFPLGNTGYYYRPNFSKTALIKLNQMDVVHCHHLFLGPEKLAGKIRPPVVYTNHTSYHLYSQLYLPIPIPFMRDAIGNRMIRRAWPQNTANCDVVIAPSHNIKTVMEEFGVTAPIEVIYNGIELNKFASSTTITPEKKRYTAVYVGRLSPEKNVLPLIDGLIKVCNRLPEAKFKLVGHGPQYAECRAKIDGSRCADQIELAGWIPAEEIPAILQSADFQITMSTSEVHPLAVIEGMAAGLPAVVLKEEAMEECVGDGAIVADDLEAWVNGVCQMANSADLKNEIGAKALARAQTYNIKQTIQQTIDLYERVIQQSALP